jgi:hypothetical protein
VNVHAVGQLEESRQGPEVSDRSESGSVSNSVLDLVDDGEDGDGDP